MSDDFIIRAEKLTKTYRLYDKPHERLFSLFRKPKADQAFDPAKVHHALRGVDLEILRGEKVAIIGRNGAGKSTLLKLVTRAIEPTSGKLDVRGKSHALLSLGAGFHPDFSGRDNAYSFLAHMGFAGKKADELVDDAIAFAELEEYIDQPLKTYSTGMQARLMFAVSTALEPDLLVIDEVLGVGDAYFQNKSFERIRELCAANNTTLLLVSHDVYSAAKLCPRIIWIDQGRVKGDGEATAMLKLYEDSIRIQEDARQKQKLALAFRREVRGRSTTLPAFIEIRARDNAPAASPAFFADMSLALPGGESYALPIFDEQMKAAALGDFFGAQMMPHSPWGPVGEIDGRLTRAWNNYGAVEHKAGLVIYPFSEKAAALLDAATLSFTVRTNAAIDADVVYIAPSGAEFILHRLLTQPGEWQAVSVALGGGSPAAIAATGPTPTGRQGSGRVVISDLAVVDEQGNRTFSLRHGEPAAIIVDYHVNDAAIEEKPQIIFSLQRNGVDDVARFICREIGISASRARNGRIIARLDPLRIGAGKYTISMLIAKEGYYENHQGKFFSINPDVYDVRSHMIEIEVIDHVGGFSVGTGVVLDAQWSHQPETSRLRSVAG